MELAIQTRQFRFIDIKYHPPLFSVWCSRVPKLTIETQDLNHNIFWHFSFQQLLPPANEVCEGYVFTDVCLSTRGGVRGCSGACMVALGGIQGCSRGVCMVFSGGWGLCMVAPRGHAWLLPGEGVCMVALGGCVWLLWGCAWFFRGGMCGFFGGGHAWFFPGGCAWFFLGGMCGFFRGGHV